MNHIWTIGPTMINEFLATASVDRVYIGVETERGVHRRSAYGINYPYIFPDRKEIFDKIPTVTSARFTEVDGGPYPAQSDWPDLSYFPTTHQDRGQPHHQVRRLL